LAKTKSYASPFARPLQPKALAELRPRLEMLVQRRIDDLIAIGSFDGVRDLAYFLPLTLVTELASFSRARTKMAAERSGACLASRAACTAQQYRRVNNFALQKVQQLA